LSLGQADHIGHANVEAAEMRHWVMFILAAGVACCSEPQTREEMTDTRSESAACVQPTCTPPPRQNAPGRHARALVRKTALAAIQDLQPTDKPIVMRGLAVQRTHFDDGERALAVHVLYRGATSSGKAVATRGIVTTDSSGASVRKIQREPMG